MISYTHRIAAILIVAACLASAGVYSVTSVAADKPVVWKPVEQALLRVDDRPVKEWNVYQEGKKTNPLLLQIGSRYLLLDSHKHEVYEIDPASIAHEGAGVAWNPADRPAKPIETSDWTVRDVGLAYKINTRLNADGRMLDLQLPHPLDIRGIH